MSCRSLIVSVFSVKSFYLSENTALVVCVRNIYLSTKIILKNTSLEIDKAAEIKT